MSLMDASKIGECYECGICTANCPLARMIPGNYNPRSTLLRLFLDPQRGANCRELWLCMRCRRCAKVCPQNLRPHELLLSGRTEALEEGYLRDPRKKMDEILELIEDKLPLPAVSGWLSLRPGEIAHTDHTLSEHASNALKAFLSRYTHSNEEKVGQASRKVSVVGSGPAGLSAAYELTRREYVVTIFEKSARPGGVLRSGIPRFRLSKQIVDAEIDRLKALGVTIKTDTAVGPDVSVAELFKEGNRALFIATGSGVPSLVGIEGETLGGVMYALDFLERLNLNGNVVLGNSVAVIGGGNVAIDAARAAIRLGPRTVQILYRRSREEMPADAVDSIEAEKEGIEIQPFLMPKRILEGSGRVVGIECVKTRPGPVDPSGRHIPVPTEGSELTVEADTVILAVGERADLTYLPPEIHLKSGDAIRVDPMSLETSMKGVFAGGDVTGSASIFEAIHAGWKGAASIDRYVRRTTTG